VLGGPYAVDGVQKPEYETCGMFGNNLLNDNMESIIKANYICNAYGLDTISTAASVAFAIECYQNGLISREDTGGLTLEWGDHAAIIGLTEKIARREDIGDLLAEGTKRAAERLGGAAPQYAMHVGGQELVAHDPRYAPTFAVNYETDATPGRHTQFGLALIEMGVRLKGLDVPDLDKYEIAGKGELNARLLNLMQAVFSMGMCSFVFQKLDVRIWPEVINAVTGWNYTFEELLNTGARIGALRQSFNVREGLPVTEFRLPGRATGHPPAATGPLAGIAIDVDTQRRETYQARGWDARNGKPLREVLVQLDLADVAADLYERPGDLPPESHARQEAE
jgi:aldehyde:ferredoxin oxidoreductase